MSSPTSPADPDRPLRRAWFASDFHLHEGDPQGVELATAFLRAARRERVQVLGLLGDVFRAWLGPASLNERGLAPFFEELAATSAAGVRVLFVHGNHDFVMGTAFARATGVEVHRAGCELALGGERVRLEHGDAFCTRDHSYQRLHAVLRSRPLLAGYAAAPTRLLRSFAGRLTRTATRTTAGKSMETMDIVDEAVVARLATGLDTIVCGHVHRARDVRLPLPGSRSGRLLVMADFERSGCHLRWENGAWELRERAPRFAPPVPPVIAIDGPAGGGKSAVGQLLAERLGWLRLDSGAIYRAVTERVLAARLENEPEAMGSYAQRLRVEVLDDGGVAVDGEPVADERLRTPAVSAHVSAVSAHPEVRRALLGVQRDALLGRPGLVAEGRDMATVVFPRAEQKIYLDARLEVRAARRLGQNSGEGRDLAAVAAALATRDARDAGRAVAPMLAAPGAYLLDTSDLSLDEVVDRIARRVEDGAGS